MVAHTGVLGGRAFDHNGAVHRKVQQPLQKGLVIGDKVTVGVAPRPLPRLPQGRCGPASALLAARRPQQLNVAQGDGGNVLQILKGGGQRAVAVEVRVCNLGLARQLCWLLAPLTAERLAAGMAGTVVPQPRGVRLHGHAVAQRHENGAPVCRDGDGLQRIFVRLAILLRTRGNAARGGPVESGTRTRAGYRDGAGRRGSKRRRPHGGRSQQPERGCGRQQPSEHGRFGRCGEVGDFWDSVQRGGERVLLLSKRQTDEKESNVAERLTLNSLPSLSSLSLLQWIE